MTPELLVNALIATTVVGIAIGAQSVITYQRFRKDVAENQKDLRIKELEAEVTRQRVLIALHINRSGT